MYKIYQIESNKQYDATYQPSCRKNKTKTKLHH